MPFIAAKRSFVGLMLLTLLLAVLAGCASATPTPQAVYQNVSEATLGAGEDIPEPSEDVILTVTGLIGAANNSDAIEMDMPTIESVGLKRMDIHDPFDDVDVTFEGVLMSDLLDVWQVADDATTLELVALNDYLIEVPIADFRDYPVLFAVKSDGEYMPVSTRGPAMLVYPYGHFDLDPQVYNDRWIWQIKSINVQ